MAQNTYTALSTQTLGTAASSVTFTSIPQGYTDLVIEGTGTINSGTETVCLRLNGDTGSNYSFTYLYGNGSSAASGRASNTTFAIGGLLDVSTIGNFQVNVMNYSNSTIYKTVLDRRNLTSLAVFADVSLWRNTAAVTSITLFPENSKTFSAGSTFTLYGIAAASVGAKATGGTIYQDSSYFYHVFSGNGTFTPASSLTADVLVVAGGGGAGDAGGGAGGLLYYSSQSLTATGYTCTVGAGGSGGKNANSNATNGSDTTFTGLTAAVGGGRGQVPNLATYSYNGGSGGASVDQAINGGTGTSGQGNNGGKGYTDYVSYDFGGGGGGAGAAGGNSTSTSSGAGGNGVSTYSSWGAATGIGQNISGTYWLAGGGAGGGGKAGVGSASTIGAAGYGGGGSGWWIAGSGAPTSGTANTGGGGGGGTGTNFAGNGGSGVIIVRYAK